MELMSRMSTIVNMIHVQNTQLYLFYSNGIVLMKNN